MFEDSTFESTGRIKTRSHRWMLAALAINGAILTAMILIPLICPDALPRHIIPALLVAPEAPKPQTPPETLHVQPARLHNVPEFDQGRITAPPTIPRVIISPPAPDLPFNSAALSMDNGPAVPGGDGRNSFGGGQPVTVVRPSVQGGVRLPSKLVEGLLIYKNVPSYPIIAKTVGIQGIVVLQAMISKTGTIEDLHVVSGPPMLRQAAIDAVKTWRYRPYLLNQQPVEVETSVSVVFKLER